MKSKSQTEGKKDLLRIVFEETTNGLGKDRRYIAKSYTGGEGWGVYDVVKGKFISKEITELNGSNVRELINEA